MRKTIDKVPVGIYIRWVLSFLPCQTPQRVGRVDEGDTPPGCHPQAEVRLNSGAFDLIRVFCPHLRPFFAQYDIHAQYFLSFLHWGWGKIGAGASIQPAQQKTKFLSVNPWPLALLEVSVRQPVLMMLFYLLAQDAKKIASSKI